MYKPEHLTTKGLDVYAHNIETVHPTPLTLATSHGQ